VRQHRLARSRLDPQKLCPSDEMKGICDHDVEEGERRAAINGCPVWRCEGSGKQQIGSGNVSGGAGTSLAACVFTVRASERHPETCSTIPDGLGYCERLQDDIVLS